MLFLHAATMACCDFQITWSRPTDNIIDALGPKLSTGASITTNTSTAPRWSDYHAPEASVVVHVAQEQDVAETVRYCNEHGHEFLAQSGGHGWATTFDMRRSDVIINMRGLNSVIVSDDKTTISVGGGALNDEFVDAAYDAGVQVLNGGCNCVGVLGATLGGGVSRFMNRYGLPADNIVSARLITANGSMLDIDEQSHSDLLWAIRGAGANFGIVTSVVMKAYPTIDEGRVWAGELTFSGDKLEGVVDAMSDLKLTQDMTVHWGFSHVGEDNTPMITAEVFFMRGDGEAGRRAFQAFYDLEPESDSTEVMAYNRINDDTVGLCEDGGRKPGWHVGLRTLDYPAFQAVWDEWVDFVARTELYSTTVLVESYSNYVLRRPEYANRSSYAHRDINHYAWTIPAWEDETMDEVVEGYGNKVREIWQETSGFEDGRQRAYMNFAHGDESLAEIYGESLPRLRDLKRQWDPMGVFNQWFPIV